MFHISIFHLDFNWQYTVLQNQFSNAQDIRVLHDCKPTYFPEQERLPIPNNAFQIRVDVDDNG